MPGLIPDAELAQLRADAETSLDTLAYIWRAPAGVDDGTGHATNVLAQVAQVKDVYVRVTEPKAPMLAVLVARLGTVEVAYISFSLDIDVRIKDEIRLSTGEAYVVHEVGEPQSYVTLNSATCGRVR